MAEEKKDEKKQELVEILELCSIPQTICDRAGHGQVPLRNPRQQAHPRQPLPQVRPHPASAPHRLRGLPCPGGRRGWSLPRAGEITSYDMVFVPTLNPLTGKMREVPYTSASILLDGGDTTLTHFLDVTDPKKLKMGMRCEAVFRPDGERTGGVTDILYFHVLPEEEKK